MTLLSFPINQAANALDWSWGVYATLASALIGYGLLVTSDPFGKHVWGAVGRRRPMITVLVAGFITGLFGAGTAWVLIRQAETKTKVQAAQPGRDDVTLRAQRLVPILAKFIDDSGAIERDIRGDKRALANLQQYQIRIEKLRSNLGEFLNRELPDSGATVLALPTEGSTGLGPIVFEHTRLVASIRGQKEILANLETYIRRSSKPASRSQDWPSLGRLAELRERAVHDLLNRNVRDTRGISRLQRDIEDWEQATVNALRGASAAEVDVTWFRVLGTFASKGLRGLNADHAHARNVLAEKLDRLLEVMRRLDARNQSNRES